MDQPTARQMARDFQLSSPPPDFIDHPAPIWAALRSLDPVLRLDTGAVYLTAYEDLQARIAALRTPERDRRLRLRGFRHLPVALG